MGRENGQDARSSGSGRNFSCCAKRLAALALIVFVCIGCVFSVESTYSWFLYASNTEVAMQSGKVNFLPKDNQDGSYGSFIPNTDASAEDTYIYPGRQLIEEEGNGILNILRLENRSTVVTNVRVRIAAQIVTNAGQTDAVTRSAVCWPDDSGVFHLGLTENESVDADSQAAASGTDKVPLLNLLFEQCRGYTWQLVQAPLRENTSEWELVPDGQAVSDAAVRIPSSGSELYNTLTSVMVVPELDTVAEELKFTELYSGARLIMTVEYLAKQWDVMDWQVFYTNTLQM